MWMKESTAVFFSGLVIEMKHREQPRDVVSFKNEPPLESHLSLQLYSFFHFADVMVQTCFNTAVDQSRQSWILKEVMHLCFAPALLYSKRLRGVGNVTFGCSEPYFSPDFVEIEQWTGKIDYVYTHTTPVKIAGKTLHPGLGNPAVTWLQP